MFFKQYYLGCLAHASYMIASNGEAAVVDPQRDVDMYIEEAKANGFTIKYVLETHMHADFVSGHLELAKRSGAKIILGPRAGAEFDYIGAKDGEVFQLGDVEILVLETPGHTPESVTYLVNDKSDPNETPVALTGDTLFFGEVGRPDLVASKGFTARQMAEMLYDSITNKIKKIEPATKVFPAHGAGSLCGKKIADKDSSTIGEELATNYALQDMDEESFINIVTENLPEVPQYFPRAATLNRQNLESLDEFPRPAALQPADFSGKMKETNTVVVDVRENEKYAAGHVPGSYSIPLSGQYAQWAGMFIAPETKILFVTSDEEEVDEATMRLARVGLHNAIGYLADGIYGWHQAGFETGTFAQTTGAEVREALDNYRFVDVRRPSELEGGVIESAENIPLDKIPERYEALQAETRPILVICRSGNRSAIAGSLLKQFGVENVVNLSGGMTAWEKAGYPTTQPTA